MNSFGQLDSFNLEQYKNPFYKRQQLDLNFNLNGSSGFNDVSYFFNPYRISGSSLNGAVQGNYYFIENSPTKQTNWHMTLDESPFFSYQKSKYDLDTSYSKTNSKRNRIAWNLQTYNRFYVTPVYFFEVDLNGSVSNDYDNYSLDYYAMNSNMQVGYNDSKTNGTALEGLMSLRFGRGRIEYVEDARLAVYILDDLRKHNRLSRTPTEEEILEFSKIITQVKNKRFFDARIRKIEEISTVDSFLVSANLINKSDAAYFTTLNDNWVNAAGPARQSGFRYSFGLTPSGLWAQGINKTNSSVFNYTNSNIIHNQREIGIAGNILVDYNKPISLKWQLDGGLDIAYKIYEERNTYNNHDGNGVSSDNTHYKDLYGTLFITLGFYPNSRTYFSGTTGLRSRYTENEQIDPANNHHYDKDLEPYLSFRGYYYISERLRLMANYYCNYSSEEYSGSLYPSKQKMLNQSFSISLSYAFF
jgi:hypothetical protein